MSSGISFTWHIDNHAFGYTGRNLDFNDFFTFHNTRTATMLTLIFDNGSFTVASRAFRLSLHHAKHGTDSPNDNTLALTGAAGLCTTPRFCTATMTMITSYILTDFKLLGNTSRYFLHRKLYFQAQIIATILLPTSTATKSSKIRETSVTTKDIAEHREDIVHIHAATKSAKTTTLRTVKSKLIILLAFLRVTKNVIGFCCFLKFFFSLRIPRITIWMIFYRNLSICFFDVVIRRRFIYA